MNTKTLPSFAGQKSRARARAAAFEEPGKYQRPLTDTDRDGLRRKAEADADAARWIAEVRARKAARK